MKQDWQREFYLPETWLKARGHNVIALAVRNPGKEGGVYEASVVPYDRFSVQKGLCVIQYQQAAAVPWPTIRIPIPTAIEERWHPLPGSQLVFGDGALRVRSDRDRGMILRQTEIARDSFDGQRRK